MILQARILEWIVTPFSGDLPNPGTELVSFLSPALAGGFFTISTTWESRLSATLTGKVSCVVLAIGLQVAAGTRHMPLDGPHRLQVCLPLCLLSVVALSLDL